MTIKKVAVIGAGVMGAGIAAQMANAGYDVELLDIVPKSGDNRNAIAEGAIEKMLKTNPAPLMHKRNAKKIRAGNTEDHLDRLGACDLIIEAVLENPAIKSAVFKKIDEHRKAGSIIASNTSTIPLKDLTADQSDQFKKDFVITHFFNPPRYMPLLELVTSEHNSPETVATITRFMDEKAGKGVVVCKDTPGFIANRIGTYWIQSAINGAIEHGLTVEEADAVVGRPMGVPKSGVFGLMDLVGLDLMPHISKSLMSKLPVDDSYSVDFKEHAVVTKMIADGYIGRKGGKGGFYRRDENKKDFAVDLATGETRPKQKPKVAAAENAKNAAKSGRNALRALFNTEDKSGVYAWNVFKKTVLYAAEHVHDISGNVTDIDTAMKLGYNWERGPFEMLDDVGLDYFISRVKQDGDKIPALLETANYRPFYKTENGVLQYMQQDGTYADVERPDGVLLLSDIKRKSKPVATFGGKVPAFGRVGAALWDIGDGVLCLEFTSKQNSLDLWTMKAVHKACDLIEAGKYKALVVHNEGKNFSYGANLGLALLAAKLKQTWIIRKLVTSGQDAYKRLKYAKFPVVSAPSGVALGGGCEILLHSHHVQAHAETYPGLVEVGVGLLPAWGGSTELLTRAYADKRLPKGPMPPMAKVFETISTAKVATSAQEAKDLYYLRATDGITMNRSRLLADAKAKALELANDPAFKPEEPKDLPLPGSAGYAALSLAVDGFYLRGAITPYDVVVSDRVARVLTGGKKADSGMLVSQDHLRKLEKHYFMKLVHDKRTVARIETMLKTGKPLREKPQAGMTARGLRHAADRAGHFITRLLTPNKARDQFDRACRKPDNDNGVKRDAKAQMNWPDIRKGK